MREYFVGLDIGGSKTELLLMDGDSQVRRQLRRPTELASPEAMLQGVIQAVRGGLEAAQTGAAQVIAMGVGIPGQVNPATGEVGLAVNLGLTAFPLGKLLAAEFEFPIVIENDVRLAALGAYHYLNGRQSLRSLAYLGLGTGASAGLILNGELHRGTRGMAGEIGHIVFDEQGAECVCGQRGCLETIIAGPAIARQAAQAGIETGERVLQELYRRSEENDPRAQSIVNRVVHYIARAVQWLLMTYDVDQVVLGGGVAEGSASLHASVVQELSRLQAQSALVELMQPDRKLSVLPPDFGAGARGAIRLAQQFAATTNQSDW